MLNEARIIGRISAIYPSEKITRIIVMTNEKYKDKEGNVHENSDAHKVACFRNQKEYVDNYSSVGDLVLVSGKLKSNRFTNEAGETRESYQVVLDSIRTIKKKSDSADNSAKDKPKEEDKPTKDQGNESFAAQNHEFDEHESLELPF